jgi:hypothetical protein
VQPASEQRVSGVVVFAAVMAAVIGVFNVLSGIAAIAKDDLTEQSAKVLFDINITAWGWFWLILGGLQILTSYLIFRRSMVGLVLGVLWAAISASLAVFVIFTYPIWALVVIGIDMIIIFGLLDNIDAFE